MSVRIDRDVINALIAGHFADPFSVLGMHRTEAGLEVRALLPDATEVWVIEPKTGRKVGKLECIDSRGFFAGREMDCRAARTERVRGKDCHYAARSRIAASDAASAGA